MVFREGRMVEDGQGGKKYERYAEPRMQRLLWLDPEPEARAILTRPKIRDVDERTH